MIMVKLGNLNELPKFALREYRPPYGTYYINFQYNIPVRLFFLKTRGPEWLNELGSWITLQHIQAYHQYGVGSHLAL